jgi:hypothetical protein
MRRYVVVAETRLCAERNDERNGNQDERGRQTNAEIMSMALFPRQYDEGEKKEDVAYERDDRYVVRKCHSPLEVVGEEPVTRRTWKAAGGCIRAKLKPCAEASSNVWFLSVCTRQSAADGFELTTSSCGIICLRQERSVAFWNDGAIRHHERLNNFCNGPN